jgi:hypothetical protein
MVDQGALDEAVRRFPAVIARARLWRRANFAYDPAPSLREFDAIRREYHLILAERAKSRRIAA